MRSFGSTFVSGICINLTLQTLIIRYTIFALLATAVNILTQRLVLSNGTDTLHYLAAMIAGTFTGLVIKYVLDKRWIFHDHSGGAAEQGKKFILYSTMGLLTTAIFWSTETFFWLVWQTENMREIGAVLGLTVGYVVKYNLDRRYVFTDAVLQNKA